MAGISLKRLIWSTGINGISITGVAAVAVLASAFGSPSPAAVLGGLGVVVFGCLEVWGWLLLRRDQPGGLVWARNSQIGVFVCISGYSLFQLLYLTPETALSLVSPETGRLLMGLYEIDEGILAELLYLVGRVTYVTLMTASLIYQGGLFWYYSRSLRKLAASDR